MDEGSWYEEVGTGQGLLQGDFIFNCPTLIPPDNLEEIESGDFIVDVEYHNAVILTQSCDLYSKGVGNVSLCPIYPFKKWLERSKDYQSLVKNGTSTNNLVSKEFEKLRKGNYTAFHLLNKEQSAGFEDFQVVELGSSFTVKRSVIDSLIATASERFRMKSPYREHLSQAFAVYFMRVALPNDSLTISDLNYYRPKAADQN